MKEKKEKLYLKINFRMRTLTINLTYFRENWGVPFVVGFQILLLVCAVFFIQGNSSLANNVAVYAYFLLVIGVFLQFASSLKRERGRENDE